MNNLNVMGLNPVVADKITPMVEDLLREHASNIHSFHVVGSAAVPDYNEKISDINSVVVLHNMDLQFIRFLAPLGEKYGKKRIAAPLVMTPEYINRSLDAFPVEFLDFKLVHKTVYGHDLLQDLQITMPNLRLQCEREIKTKLIGLRQGYLSSLGKKKLVAAVLVRLLHRLHGALPGHHHTPRQGAACPARGGHNHARRRNRDRHRYLRKTAHAQVGSAQTIGTGTCTPSSNATTTRSSPRERSSMTSMYKRARHRGRSSCSRLRFRCQRLHAAAARYAPGVRGRPGRHHQERPEK